MVFYIIAAFAVVVAVLLFKEKGVLSGTRDFDSEKRIGEALHQLQAHLPCSEIGFNEFKTLCYLNPGNFHPLYLHTLNYVCSISVEPKDTMIWQKKLGDTSKVTHKLLGFAVYTGSEELGPKAPEYFVNNLLGYQKAINGYQFKDDIVMQDMTEYKDWMFVMLKNPIDSLKAEQYFFNRKKEAEREERERTAAHETGRNKVAGAKMLTDFAVKTAREQQDKLDQNVKAMRQSVEEQIAVMNGTTAPQLVLQDEEPKQQPTNGVPEQAAQPAKKRHKPKKHVQPVGTPDALHGAVVEQAAHQPQKPPRPQNASQRPEKQPEKPAGNQQKPVYNTVQQKQAPNGQGQKDNAAHGGQKKNPVDSIAEANAMLNLSGAAGITPANNKTQKQ